MKNSSSQKLIFVIIAILVAAVTRLIPHLPNFTPVAAMALFGGVYLKDKKFAFIVPLVALFFSDILTVLLINYKYTTLSAFFTSYSALSVYISFTLVVVLGMFIQNNVKVGSVAIASLISSTLFFLITNFAVFAASPLIYSQDVSGLMACYSFALPFYGYGIIGDLFYSAILFGAFYFTQQRIPALVK